MSSTPGVDIVIAEDSRIQAKILERRLTEAGHRVRWGADGQAAPEEIVAPATRQQLVDPEPVGQHLRHQRHQNDHDEQ